MAGGDVARTLLFQPWRDLATKIGGELTAPGKGAAVDALLEARHLAGDLGPPPRRAGERGTELGHRAEQALSIGMTRRAEKLDHRRLLDFAAGIHDQDAF